MNCRDFLGSLAGIVADLLTRGHHVARSFLGGHPRGRRVEYLRMTSPSFDLPAGNLIPIGAYRRMRNAVNREPFGGHRPGTLRFIGCSTRAWFEADGSRRGSIRYIFGRGDRPWNVAAGGKVYPEAEFGPDLPSAAELFGEGMEEERTTCVIGPDESLRRTG